jgi:UDP-2,3-diacylglucosamine pyrophosphatase LpxH
MAHALEKRFRNTNTRHKAAFPAATCEQYAQRLFAEYDTVVLGHFHYQYQQTTRLDGHIKSFYVLPAWKDTPVYLEISNEGRAQFKTFEIHHEQG